MRQRIVHGAAALLLAGLAPLAQSQDQKAQTQKTLISQFALTTTTKDKGDIATAGAVLVLHKSNLLMYATSNPIPPQSTYKKGKITRNAFGRGFLSDLGNSMANPGSSAAIVQRTFVTDEKFWVTNIDVKDDGVIFRFFSDPINDVRYFGELKFPFAKGQVPPADEMLNTIAEVLTVDLGDNSQGGGAQSQTFTAGAAGPPPIAPPPPPSDTPPPPPKTITLGQTKDQVVAAFGQPQKVATVGSKEIDYYPDMKVTLVNGKVTDVE
jgi:hypothetical protein